MSHPIKPRLNVAALRILIAAACLSLASCGGNHSALNPAGPQSERIGNLWWLLFTVSVIVFVLVVAFMLYGAYRSRRRNNAATDENAERRMARAVSIAVAVTVVTLFGLLVASVLTGRAISPPPSGDFLTIKITGHQWWWEVEYEDPVASQRVTTANEIHIPTGQTVMLKLTSHDVIHSFWVPSLHGKKDLIPDHEIITTIQADAPGTFRGQCAEFCGHQHAHMAFFIIAEPPDQFQAWLENQRKPSVQPADQLQARGQQVFLTKSCVLCHTIQGTPAGAHVGPNLTHVASRQTIAAGTIPFAHDSLARWVVDSQSVKPGNRMPQNMLSPEELQALLAYLESLK